MARAYLDMYSLGSLALWEETQRANIVSTSLFSVRNKKRGTGSALRCEHWVICREL
jgi:hypothetical protein